MCLNIDILINGEIIILPFLAFEEPNLKSNTRNKENIKIKKL